MTLEQPGNNAEMVADIVRPAVFIKSMIPLVSHLWCGADRDGVEATYWIHGHEPPSVRTELNKGGRVWIYRNNADEIVGFGSLNIREWAVKGSPPLVLQTIPRLGVFTDHQGLPPPGSGSPKYCYQILDHLIDTAEEKKDQYPFLGLAVWPDNEKAIHVYEAAGFEWFNQNNELGLMILPLD